MAWQGYSLTVAHIVEVPVNWRDITSGEEKGAEGVVEKGGEC